MIDRSFKQHTYALLTLTDVEHELRLWIDACKNMSIAPIAITQADDRRVFECLLIHDLIQHLPVLPLVVDDIEDQIRAFYRRIIGVAGTINFLSHLAYIVELAYTEALNCFESGRFGNHYVLMPVQYSQRIAMLIQSGTLQIVDLLRLHVGDENV